jgi:beta-N-acetylhexosaminidase
MNARAFICGVSGLELTGTERGFLREADPWGLILFKRNVDSPEQVRRLVGSFRELVGRDEAAVLIDQEGGRVQRLGPPHWPTYPSGSDYGRLYDRERSQGLAAARLGGRLMAADLAALGISVDCLPVADVPVAGSNAVIGDRAYGLSPAKVAAKAAAIAQGF